MRKWMRERLQRRKKTPAEPSEQPVPPPLQPAYFEAEQMPEAAPAKDSSEAAGAASNQHEAHTTRQAPAPPEEQPAEEQPATGRTTLAGGSTGRGRRRRGGRGRGGRGR